MAKAPVTFDPGNPPPGWTPPEGWTPIEEHRELYPETWAEGREGRPFAEERRPGPPLPIQHGFTYDPSRYVHYRGRTGAWRGVGEWLAQTAAPLLAEEYRPGKTYADALEAFSQSWAGRTLLLFDAGAVALERATALGRQYVADPEDVRADWGAAWRAGDLYYEVFEMVPTEGGVAEELSRARQMIAQGATPEEALGAFLERLTPEGASQAMVADVAGHIILDPINVLLGYVRPVQATHRVANLARWGTRVAPDVIDAARATARTSEAALDAAVAAGRVSNNVYLDAVRAAETLAELVGKRALSPFEPEPRNYPRG